MTDAATGIAQNAVFEHVARAGMSSAACFTSSSATWQSGSRWVPAGQRRPVRSVSGVVRQTRRHHRALGCDDRARDHGVWRLAETALGRSTDPKKQSPSSEVLDRAKAFALAVVYFGFAYSTLGFARGAGKSTGDQNSGLSARLMQTATGTVVLIGAGIIIVAVGGYHIYKGASRNFLDHLKGTSSVWCDARPYRLHRQRPRDRRRGRARHHRGKPVGARQSHRTRRGTETLGARPYGPPCPC